MDIIFDIDGTLMNIEHRRRYVDRSLGKPDWATFREATPLDQPFGEMFTLGLALDQAGHRIIFMTGRMEKDRAVTVSQLVAGGFGLSLERADWAPQDAGPVFAYPLHMRHDDDFRSDVIVKHEMLQHARSNGYDPVMAFDDRQSVVDMWRAEGIRCCQVDVGNF